MSNIQYTEDQLLLVLNYDTYSKEVLTLEERIKIHQLINRIQSLRPYKIEEELSAKIAAVLVEINHVGYERMIVRLMPSNDAENLIEIKKHGKWKK